MRRLRQNALLREMVRETRLSVSQLVQPLFVCPGRDVERPVPSMPGCAQMSRDRLVKECRDLWERGLRSVLLFGIPERKDPEGSAAVAVVLLLISFTVLLGIGALRWYVTRHERG